MSNDAPKNNVPLEKARPIVDDLAKRGVEALRSAKNGWQSIAQGKNETRQQRIIRENHERSQAIRNGKNPNDTESSGWKPGDDDTYDANSDGPSLRRLMENHNRMQKQNQNKSQFKGTPELIALKMVSLFENAKTKPEIVSVEESGFNTYTVTYIAG